MHKNNFSKKKIIKYRPINIIEIDTKMELYYLAFEVLNNIILTFRI